MAGLKRLNYESCVQKPNQPNKIFILFGYEEIYIRPAADTSPAFQDGNAAISGTGR
jgi:hypothetical protein